MKSESNVFTEEVSSKCADFTDFRLKDMRENLRIFHNFSYCVKLNSRKIQISPANIGQKRSLFHENFCNFVMYFQIFCGNVC